MNKRMEKHSNERVEIFSGTFWEADIVKSLLENADITAFIKDGIMGTLYPWYTAPGGAGAVGVTINSDDYEKAKAIVEDYLLNKK